MGLIPTPHHSTTTPPMNTAITPVTSGADPAQAAAAANQTLTQANFLQLLVTQMSSQDPLNPQSDTEFAAQLAQFSALQQSQAMQQNMAILQANSMIGELVTVSPAGASAPVVGQVSGVQIQSGAPVLIVNGQSFNLSQVTAFAPPVSLPASAANSTQTSN